MMTGMRTLKIIFYLQIVFAVLCDSIVWVLELTRPLVDFNLEQIRVEELLSREGHFINHKPLEVLHYFTSSEYHGGLVSFYALQITCLSLVFGGIMGLGKLSSFKNEVRK
jgi:hypothetical protein